MKHFTLHHLWRLAAVLLAILIYPAQVARGAVEIDGIQYNLTASTSRARIAEAESLESDIFDGNLTVSGDVSIPETITYGSKEYTVTNIGKGAFNNNTSITTLTIPSTIEYIGPAAFGNCTGVTDVYCFISDPLHLTWDLSNAEYYPPFKADGSTRFHVPSSLLNTYENKFGTSYVTFVGDLDGESAAGLVSTHHHWELATTNETNKLGTMRTSESNDWNVFIKDPNAGVNTASMHSNTTGNLETMLDINPSGSNKIEVTLNNMNMFQVSGVVSKIIVNASGGFRTIDAFIGEKNSTTDQYASVTNYSDGYLSDFELTFDGTTEYTDAIITLAFNEVSSMGIHSITIVQEGGGGGGASEITTTFNSQVSSDTNYPGNFYFNSEEDKEWHCYYVDYTSDVPIYYTSLDGTGCIMLGNTSPSTSQSFMFENMFSFSGPVQKIIVNAAGNIEFISATIQERSDGSNQQEPYVFMEETDYAFKDYVITCDGSSYTDAWVRLNFNGKSPAFIRSITIVVGGSSSGSSTIYTFDGCQDILVNGNYKCATFTTTISKNWSAAVKDTDAEYSYTSYGNSAATVETCIYVKSNSDVCELYNQTPYSGKIKKIILRLGGGYFDGVSAAIRTEGKSDFDEESHKDVGKYISDFQDVEIPFAGTTEYSDAQLFIYLYGSGSFFIHSITIVAEEGEGGESGPATSGTSGDLTWTVTENGTTMVWESGVGNVEKTAYRLTFSGTGSMENYSMEQNADGNYVSTAPWMAFPTITEVVIGEGATNVGVYAFAHLDNLFSVSLPNSLKTIGAGAFQNCRFNSITLPNGLETIETAAFYWCTGLTSVTIPASVTTIETSAFQGNDLSTLTVASGNPKYDSRNDCNAIIETATNTLIVGTPATVIPSDVTALAEYAFNNMWYLKKVTIPEGVVSIGASAFSTCQNLEDIVLPSTVTTIGAWAFYCCNYALTKFTIGSGVTNIGKNVFDRCDKLADVYCYADPANLTWTNYSATSTFMANKATKFHVPANYLQAWQTKFPDINATYVGDLEGGDTPTLAYSGTTGDLTWEAYLIGTDKYRLVISGTGSMADYTMHYQTGSTAPWNEFMDKITEVLINSGAHNVGAHAFYKCTNLTTVSLPNTVTTISQRAFAETAITALTLPSSLKTIDQYIIFSCPSLKSLTIPASVTNIATMALQNNHLTSLTVASGNTKYDSRNNCNAIIETATNTLIAGTVNTVFPSDVTAIGERAFSQVDITTMDIPEGVTSIGEEAFYNCEALTEVTIPNTVTTIGLSCFASCSKLLTVTIGTGVTTIANGLFSSSQFVDDVYCYANPATLTWTGYDRTDFFKGSFKATKFHVPANYLQAWQTKFPNINATYVGDLVNPAATDYKILVFGVNVTSENCADIKAPGVTGHINYDPITNVLTLQDVTADGTNQDWTWAVVWANGFFSNHEEFNMTILLKGTNVITNSGEAFGGHNFTFVGDGASAKLTVNGRKRAINAIQEAVIDGCILDLTSTERDAIGANKLSIKNGAYVHLKSPEGQLLTEITEKPIFDAGIEILTASVNVSRKQNSDNQWVWCFTLDATPDEGSVLNATEVTIGAPKGATINGIHYSFDPITLQATVVSDATAKYTGDINIPENVTFEGNNYTVTAIDEWAFDECNEVTSITLPSTLTFIGQDAFSYCDNVKELVIPASVTVIGSGAFNGMRGLETLRVEEGNPVYDSRENCNAVVRTAQNEVYGACKNTTYPASITAMGRAALLNHWELTNLDLPENITYIGFNSVSNATNVTTVRLRGQITDIRYANFTGYNNLKDFYIYATTPPAIQRNVFIIDDYAYSTEIDQVTLHVPAASVDAYAAANVWKEFAEIVAIEDEYADISPITEEKIVEMIKISTSTLDDAIVDEVYYNLDSEKGNGYDEDDDCIVIAETTDMSQIEDKKPGSEEVKEEFKGIILKVEAGKGVLSIDVKTVGSNKLAVQFGNCPPELRQSNEKQTIQIGYNVTRATYIYIYAVSGAAGVKGQFLAPTVENGVKIYGFSIDPTIDEIPENIPVVDEEQIATDIAEIEAAREGFAIYDTAGRRIGKAVRKQGIYVTNKRKVAVK